MTERPAEKRVLHVMWSMRIGGAERALYQLVLAQRAMGMDVGVLVAGEPGLYGQRLKAAGVQLESLRQSRGFQPLSAWRARAVFRQWPVVHFHVAEPLLMLAAASTRARMYYSHRAGQFDYQLSRRLRYRMTGMVVSRSFAALVGNTGHAANAAAMLFGVPRAEIGVVYNGLDWSLLAPEREAADVRAELSIPPGSVVFGTSGNLRPFKRVDLALHALRLAGAPATLVVIGDGPERSALERLASELSLTDQVRFTGKTANVADYLQVLDAFLLLSGPEESFGNSAVEAMGFGIPTIVMHDGGGLTEHVDHEMTGVVATDVRNVAAWIHRLASDPGLRDRLGRNARDSVRHRYTVDQMIAGYSALYSVGRTASSGRSPVGVPSARRVD